MLSWQERALCSQFNMSGYLYLLWLLPSWHHHMKVIMNSVNKSGLSLWPRVFTRNHKPVQVCWQQLSSFYRQQETVISINQCSDGCVIQYVPLYCRLSHGWLCSRQRRDPNARLRRERDKLRKAALLLWKSTTLNERNQSLKLQTTDKN